MESDVTNEIDSFENLKPHGDVQSEFAGLHELPKVLILLPFDFVQIDRGTV